MLFTDQCGNQIQLHKQPTRIVSLVPSQTELLFDLGLDHEIAGITRYCVHPTHWRHQKTIVGGTKNFDLDLIDSLKPDLIIANKEENYKEGIELVQSRYPVWISDIYSLKDALKMITSLGDLTSHSRQANDIVRSIQENFAEIRKFESNKVLYLIWRKPWMVAASSTFIDAMLVTLGFQNCAKHLSRYPVLTNEEIQTINPDVIFLSSEPFPFREKHIEELQLLCPQSKVMLVDGEMFSWYGSRLVQAPAYFNSISLA
jgi:ABC-type Fe3+-hydroxamate transport system substrate-binding protein